MKKCLKENLEELRNKMYEYAQYLQDYTYHPYDKIEEFARELDKIIEENEE